MTKSPALCSSLWRRLRLSARKDNPKSHRRLPAWPANRHIRTPWNKSGEGQVLPSGMVKYSDAMEGTDADVTYYYSMTSFEQNVIIRKQFPSLSDLGISSDPSNLRLAVITELIDPPPMSQIPNNIDVREKNQQLGLQGD